MQKIKLENRKNDCPKSGYDSFSFFAFCFSLRRGFTPFVPKGHQWSWVSMPWWEKYHADRVVPSGRTGFTLLEMTLAIGIFSFLVVAAVGIMLGLSAAQFRAQANQSVLDNARFGLELLIKELRTGYQFSTVSFCGMNALSPVLTFKHANSNPSDNSGRTYYLVDTDRDPDTDPDTIVRSKRIIANSSECYLQSGDTGPNRFLEFSAEEVIIEAFNIILRGQTVGAADGQPNATVSIRLKARNPQGKLTNPVTIQTTVVQRLRDIQ